MSSSLNVPRGGPAATWWAARQARRESRGDSAPLRVDTRPSARNRRNGGGDGGGSHLRAESCATSSCGVSFRHSPVTFVRPDFPEATRTSIAYRCRRMGYGESTVY